MLTALATRLNLTRQGQRTLSPLCVEDFEERVEAPAAAALQGEAFACGMWF